VSAKFCPFYGVCTSVKTVEGNVLVLGESDIEADMCEQLSASPGKYTRLMLSVGVGFEEFTVTCANGCLKLSPTPSTSFVPGDPVWFESCSAANIKDMINCLDEDGEIDADPLPKIEGYNAVQNVETGEWCYELDNPKEPISFVVGKQQVSMDVSGCWTSSAAPAGTVLESGEYTYATITVDNNCNIIGIKNGMKPACSSCGGCCGCGDKDTSTQTTLANLACQEGQPSVEGVHTLWFEPSSGCLSVLCEGTWVGINGPTVQQQIANAAVL